jgi:hypothetical protein
MSSIMPLPYPTSEDNSNAPCALCEAGCPFNYYHMMRHSNTTGRAESFTDILMKEPIKEYEHEVFDYFDDFTDFDFEDVDLFENNDDNEDNKDDELMTE